MQKITLTYKTPIADIKDGKPVLTYKTETSEHIVASTKTQNILLDELKKDNKIPTDVTVKEVFLNKEDTAKAIAELVKDKTKDNSAIEKMIVEHAIKAMDLACMFKKPAVIRKK